MSAIVSAVRLFQTRDEQDHPLPSPKPLDLATDTVPFGASVRVEVEVASADPVYPPDVRLKLPEMSSRAPRIFVRATSAQGKAFAGEFRYPTDLITGEDILSGPPYLPQPQWPGTLPVVGGEYRLCLTPIPVGAAPHWGPDFLPVGSGITSWESKLRFAAPPATGGTLPKVAKVSTSLLDGSVLLGQPWLLTAELAPSAEPPLAVFFLVRRQDRCVWGYLRDDGSRGDEKAGDGVYSVLRVGNDWWDQPELNFGRADELTLLVQAVDRRGNWSEPVELTYQLRADLPPLWMQPNSPEVPSLLEVGMDRAPGPFDMPVAWARCGASGAWVCWRKVYKANETGALFDDGQGWDAKAGDLVHTGIVPWSPPEVVCYTVPKVGPPKVGGKLAASVEDIPWVWEEQS